VERRLGATLFTSPSRHLFPWVSIVTFIFQRTEPSVADCGFGAMRRVGLDIATIAFGKKRK
jgi:hypothetical protein